MPVVDGTPTPEDLARTEEVGEALTQMAARLPKSLRDAFTLYIISGVSLQETAEMLGLSLTATKTRVFRARSLLRSQLNEVLTNERKWRNSSVAPKLRSRHHNRRHNVFSAPEHDREE